MDKDSALRILKRAKSTIEKGRVIRSIPARTYHLGTVFGMLTRMGHYWQGPKVLPESDEDWQYEWDALERRINALRTLYEDK